MLNSKQRVYLSRLATKLKPFVMIGKGGASENVRAALDMELDRRELVKLRFIAKKDERDEIADSLAKGLSAELVRVIGNVAVFYRKNPKAEGPCIELPA